MNITVVGTGYVGLVSGTCFAETGNKVICVDIDKKKVKMMQKGKIPIFEPGLEVLFHRNIKQKRLSFTTVLKDGIKNADVIFLALPTPPGGDGSADLSYILKVAQNLSKLIKNYTVIVDKSTVPVGTAEKVHHHLAKHLDEKLFDVVSNPEFLREGVAVEDFMKPERVVIGTQSAKAQKIMKKLYKPFVRQGNPIVFMDERSAELTKYAANSFLAMKISYMNEIANLCEKVGADVDLVRRGIGTDSRIGKRFLFPGAGYGGSCFPKDVQALAKTSSEYKYDFKILKATMKVNQTQKLVIAKKINQHFKKSLKDKKIAIWGLAFKPNTDDIREAPALYTIEHLLSKGANVTVYDPEAMANVKELFGKKITYARNMYQGLKDADALAIMTEWNVFRTPDFDKMKKLLNGKLIFDGRNVFDLIEMEKQGFQYYSIGREIVSPAKK